MADDAGKEAARDDEDNVFDERHEEASRGVLQESLKRVLLGGASALLTTEEGIRALIAERRLPKEALASLLAHTDSTRKDLSRLWGRELRQAIGRMDVARELRRALSGLQFEVQAKVRIVGDDVEVGKVDVRPSHRAPPAPAPEDEAP